MIMLWRGFLTSWKNLGRNAWMALATVFVFMMALLSVNVLLGAQAMLDRVLVIVEERVDLAIYFKASTPEATVKQARFYLAGLAQVAEVRYVSPEESEAQFRERHKGEDSVLGGLQELKNNPLGPQLIVKAKQIQDYPFLVQAMQNPQYASFIRAHSYQDHRLAIERVQVIGRNIRLIGAVLVALFSLFGLLMAFNAIRVAVYTQREEIAIMRLVGASAWYIRFPFILEGIWLALIASGITAGLLYPSILWLEGLLRPVFGGQGPGLQIFFSSQINLLVGLELGALLLMTSLVSWLAVGKYIHR